MHCIDDKANQIILNHNGDWSGPVRIAWREHDPLAEGPTPLHECWCDGYKLVAGLYVPVNEPNGHASWEDPPVAVLTRAVALAVETYLRHKMESAIDDLSIDRGEL